MHRLICVNNYWISWVTYNQALASQIFCSGKKQLSFVLPPKLEQHRWCYTNAESL